MKVRNIIYIILMALFMVLSYFLFDRGFNAKTKLVVNYQEHSDVSYKVHLHGNDIYDSKYLSMNERYITKLVDNILVDFNYNILFDNDISGYYRYKVIGTLVAYQDDINDSLWKKDYILLSNKTEVLSGDSLNTINIVDSINIDYDKFKDELNNFMNDYNIKVSGYLMVKVSIEENLDFFGIDKLTDDEKEIKMLIPLTYDTFRIDIVNDNNNIDKFYDFSKKEPVNYLLLIIGAFSLSLGISFLALTIRNIVFQYRDEYEYKKRLAKIIREHGDILVNVKKFYSKHKYNLIYVASFEELMDAYRRVVNPISYKEIKKNEETIFLMVDEDNAWIYRLVSKDK